MKDTKQKLSHITISLHWLVAIGIIALLAVGVYMEETHSYGLYPIHKSFGIIIFIFVLIRVAWRIKAGWPTPVSEYKNYEQVLSKLIHWVLIIGTVLMPVSGMMMSGLGGHGIIVFGVELMASNPDPDNANKVLALNGNLAGFGHSVHHWLGKIMIASVVLHVVGAFKHHIIDKDRTLLRMLGKKG